MTRWLLPYLLLASAAHAQLSQPFTVGTTSSPAKINNLFQDLYDRVPTWLFSSDKSGLAPASGGGTSTFLRADGLWAAVPTPTPHPTPTVVYATLITWLDTPDQIDDWIAGTVVTGTLVDLSNDGVAIGATAVILSIYTLDGGATAGLQVGPSSRGLGNGDTVAFTAASVGGDYRARNRFMVQIGTDRKLNAKWLTSNALSTNECYVVGYTTSIAINQ